MNNKTAKRLVSFIHKNDRPWPNQRLKRAAIIGHTTPTSARVWFRAGQPGKFSMLHFAEKDGNAADWFDGSKESVPFPFEQMPESIRRDELNVAWDTDTTGVVDLDGLPPDELRRYALYSHGEKRVVLGHDKNYAFKTPSEGEDKFRFGLFSCHMPFIKAGRFSKHAQIANMDMWDLMSSATERKRPDFLIGGGDQCYTDGVKSLDIWKHLNKVIEQAQTHIRVLRW